MNKELKFKAWDGMSWFSFNFSSIARNPILQRLFTDDQTIIVEFTGMTAKNGDIYNGDVVQFYMSGVCCNLEVKWVKERSGWTPLYKTPEDLEIIGSVYSDSTLREKETV